MITSNLELRQKISGRLVLTTDGRIRRNTVLTNFRTQVCNSGPAPHSPNLSPQTSSSGVPQRPSMYTLYSIHKPRTIPDLQKNVEDEIRAFSAEKECYSNFCPRIMYRSKGPPGASNGDSQPRCQIMF